MPTFTGTSPNNVMDLWDLEHELRKARKNNDVDIKPRVASREEIQRDRTWNGGIHCPSRY